MHTGTAWEGNTGVFPAEAGAPVDLARLKSFSAGNPQAECYFVQLFFRQAHKALERLRQNCVDGENAVWSEAAHLLKSSAASFSATHLYALCEQAQYVAAKAAQRRQQAVAIAAEIQRIRDFLVLQPGWQGESYGNYNAEK